MRHLITFCLFAFIFSLSGAQVFPENAWGVYTWAGYNSREVTPAKTPLVKGGPIILKWSKIEPENGKFEFETQLGANLEQLYNDGYYTTVMIWVAPATTEVTETDTVWNNTPKWLFHEGGVPLVAFPARLDPLGKESTKYFPYYLHENYKFYFHRMIEEFGNYIKGLPAHLRERILFLQSAEGSTGDGQGYKGDPIDPQYNITQDQWSAFRIETWEKYVEAFSKDGELLIPLLTNYDSNREEQYNWMLNNLPKAAGLKNGMFSHGYHISDAQERLVSFNNFRDAVEAQGKVFFSRGEMDAEYKTYGWSTQNIPQALYWSGIYAAHCGLNLWNVPTDACQDAKNKDAQLFFNHYATQERPELAQRAFCALRRGLDASDTQTFPVSIYGSAEKSNTQRYINIANAFSSYGAKMGDPEKATGGGMINRKRQDYNDAGWKILTGNYQQHLSQINPEETSIGLWHVDKSVYGRFARSFEHASGRDTMYFQLHKDMFDGSADTVTFIVRYLDKENGSTWSFAYDAGEAALNTAYSITCNGSGTWKTQTVTVPDAVLNRNGPLGADIALINTDGKDDIFHMIEVEKGVAFPISKKKNNALLKSITWPDIPDSISTDFNWTGKVIPGFDSGTYSYEIQLPQEYQQIPALLAETEDVNATISSVMATNLTGGFDPRTSKFIVTAEDGKTKLTYSITFSLSASGNSEDKQPFVAEPLFTRFVYREWFNNNYIEISNPGTEDLDLSQYLVAIGVSSTPEQIITDTLTYDMRYNYYVPGRDYSSDDSLLYVPGIVVEDTEVNPVIELGGSFVIGHIENAEMEENSHLNDCDIIINRELSFDTEVKLIVPGPNTIMKNAWFTGALCLYKILNDSVRNGSKEISDPADFQLIDVFGTYDGSDWAPDGASLLAEDNQWNITRKPEFWEGDTLPGFSGSWGATEEASEWICVNRDEYRATMSYPLSEQSLTEGIGSHTFNPVTEYKSTIFSDVYIVSVGYETPQKISEIPLNTAFNTFLANIIKKHQDQLIVLTSADGTEKTMEEIIAEGDSITVTSADGVNTTKYGLHLGTTEKSSDAELLAADGSGYSISHTDNRGTIDGIIAGSTLAQVLENIIIPDKARLDIIDDQNNLVPLQTLTSDGSYTNTLANKNFRLKVTAEDNFTSISYDLDFIINEDEAYAWSYLYEVDQEKNLITQIPADLNVSSLFRYVMPNTGASIKLIDRVGLERRQGPVDFEDYVVVTSANEAIEKPYQLNFIGEVLGTETYVTSDTYSINQETYVIDSILHDTPIEEFLNHITVAPFARMVILDQSMSAVASGILDEGHSVQVTSGDGEMMNIYHLSFYILGTEAYITSDTFNINQEILLIDSMLIETPVSEFLDNITAAEGATIIIFDADQMPLTSGNLSHGYTIHVTSEDGLTEVIYTINFYEPVFVPGIETMPIRIYPNPAKDQINIKGIAPQSTITILNMYGSKINTTTNRHSEQIDISILNLNPGVYFVQVKNKNDLTLTKKFVKE